LDTTTVQNRLQNGHQKNLDQTKRETGLALFRLFVCGPLKDAIEMFPEFKAEEDLLLADKRYTVFAVAYPGWEEAKEQNDALAKLRESAEQAKIRILEVRLHHP
jgi:uncharacterized protein YciI